jgi:hypothetical protein
MSERLLEIFTFSVRRGLTLPINLLKNNLCLGWHAFCLLIDNFLTVLLNNWMLVSSR